MRSTTFYILISLLCAGTVQAGERSDSLAMQLARRVAAMENSRDLPSRAVWLGNRVARNSRGLAFLSDKTTKKNSKRPRTLKN